MGFFRRFSAMPDLDVLDEIEGVVVIDGVVAGVERGAASGVACVVGECADVTYGVAISALGVVTTAPRPVEILGADFEAKVGGLDELIGEQGGDRGNVYLACKNLAFSRLVVVPVNNASSQGGRLYRDLPTNVSATNPSPVVDVSGATVPAGTEFRFTNNRVRLRQAVTFSGAAEYHRGVDGSVTLVGAPAAFQAFDAASGNFLALVRDDGKIGAKVGDILVMGVIGAAGAQGANAGMYRVRAVTDADTLSLEKLDGSTFDWTTSGAMAWRLYTGAVADTGGEFHVGQQGGYRIPAQPFDASIAVDLTGTPTVQADPTAATATAWSPLSGLKLRSSPVTGFVYSANVQAANAASHADLDVLYDTALRSLLEDTDPAADVSIVWCARTSATIRSSQAAVLAIRKGQGSGAVGVFSPPLDTVSKDTVLTDTAPGVGAKRSREGIYSWPGVASYSSALVGKSTRRADGTLSVDGTYDIASDGYLASIMSCLRPEQNPGETTSTVQELLATWQSLQLGVSGLDVSWYKRAKAKGIAAPRISRGANSARVCEFQSGVTTSLTNGEREINVRRFSFYVQDTARKIADPYCKQLLTPKLRTDFLATLTEWLDSLYPDRIALPAEIDAIRGNTRAQLARGIYVVKVQIEMIPDARSIVLDTRVGYNVLDVAVNTLLAA